MIDWITGLMNSLGYAGIAFLMFLENIFPPIPSEVVMPLAGFTAAEGPLSLVGVIVAGVVGSVAGALPWYYAGKKYGAKRMRHFAERYGRWITVSPEDIDHATAWFERHGGVAVLIGRLVPGVRTLISVPAGISGMPMIPFLLYSTIGTVAWTGALAACGYILRGQWQAVEAYISPISTAVIAGLVALHQFGACLGDVEAADQVDHHRLREVLQRHRPVAAEHAPGAQDAGAIDAGVEAAEEPAGGGDIGGHAGLVGDIGAEVARVVVAQRVGDGHVEGAGIALLPVGAPV